MLSKAVGFVKNLVDALLHPAALISAIRNDYPAVVALISALIVALNELTPALDFIPVAQHFVTVTVAGLGALLTSLKAHESLTS